MKTIEQEIQELSELSKKANYNDNDIQTILTAANFAIQKHNGQFRKSGEPYVIHPIETAKILINWDLDLPTIIAGLLHDVLEDTMTEEKEIKDLFGNEVLTLVKYVTKVSLYSRKNRTIQEEKSELEKKYTVQVFLSMASDLRAMIIKLADRYHNMTTIEYLPLPKQQRIAKETFEIYAKVAGRLGMYNLKTELLDMSFAVLNPQAYQSTKAEMQQIIKQNEQIWHEMTNSIQNILASYSMQAEIKDRVKGIYSTWEKQQNGYEIKDIHDIYAIRIITKNILDCYTILGLIHLNFSYLKNTFKDYISAPKLNLYQSIHTTITKDLALMEVQIRTNEIDMVARNGLAAHWRYKDKEDKLNYLISNNGLIQEFLKSPEKNVEEIKKLSNDVVFDVLILNDSKTYIINSKTKALDLAYRFDPDHFPELLSVYINGERGTFETTLHQGDVIKFTYTTNGLKTIKEKWLKYTNSRDTQNIIKNILDVQNKAKILNVNDFISNIKTKLGSNFIGQEKMLLILKKKMGVESIEDFLENIPTEIINDNDLVNIFDRRKNISKIASINLNRKYAKWRMKQMYFNPIEGLAFNRVEYPSCCNKVPYMSVIGKMVKGDVLEIHSHDCINAKPTRFNQKIYPLTWNQEQLEKSPRTFKFTVSFLANWLPSIGNIISKNVNRFKLSLSEIKIKRIKSENTCIVDLVLYVNNISVVKACFNKISEEISIKSDLNF